LSTKVEKARRDALAMRDKFERGEDGVTASDVALAFDAVTIASSQDLVDDPFLPGQKVRPSLAHIHPERRFDQACIDRFNQEAS
jgi:hypothetical protein